MVIPKYPDVPTLTKNKSIKLQKSFSKRNNNTKCDAIFVFGGSHPAIGKLL